MKSYLLLLSLVICLTSSAQDNIPAADTNWMHVYRAEATRINDLVDTKLDVKFDYSKSYMYGKEWLTVHPHFYPTDTLTLDAKGMNINEVSLYENDKKSPLKYVYDDSMFLCIHLNKVYKANENYTVYIDYVSKPEEWKNESASAAIAGAKGLYFINPRGEEKDKPTQIWTQGETEHNSVWMPTIDKPNQKTTEQIMMTVPDKYITLSNGLLISQKKNADGTRTDVWKMDLPHAPYLFFMGVGDYAVIRDSYEGKEVNYYVEKEYAAVARRIFGLTPEMMKFYAQRLGVDFPWQKYDQITGRDYVSGAMENTTATLHSDAAQQNARELKDGNAWEDDISHELFHQWFGDLVTCESWSNITVNESFADFSETLWEEYKYGKDKGDMKNYNDMQAYLNSNNDDKTLVRFYYADKEDLFDAVSYSKGGRVLNMLRNYLGEDAFFASLKKYLIDNKFKTGEAQQLRLAFESVTGKDLNWFWNEWYYGKGEPVLDISYVYDDYAHTAKVIVQQKQTQQVFKMPVNIDIYNGATKTRHQVWIQNPVDTFTFNYITKPDLINFDGDKILLCKKTDHKTTDNFKAQWKYAPLYVDRIEALDYFAGNNMIAELSLGLTDKFYGVRSYTLDKLAADTNVLTNQTILMQVQNLALTEEYNLTKAKAISIIGAAQNPQYKSIFEKDANDSSYSVAGAALQGLAYLDVAEAYTLAKKYSADAKGDLKDVIPEIILLHGSPDDYDTILKYYDNMPPNEIKIAATQAFCAFLSKLNDPQKVEIGVDIVIAFRNTIPQDYKTVIDPLINNSLQQIATVKGGDVQAYIEAKMK